MYYIHYHFLEPINRACPLHILGHSIFSGSRQFPGRFTKEISVMQSAIANLVRFSEGFLKNPTTATGTFSWMHFLDSQRELNDKLGIWGHLRIETFAFLKFLDSQDSSNHPNHSKCVAVSSVCSSLSDLKSQRAIDRFEWWIRMSASQTGSSRCKHHNHNSPFNRYADHQKLWNLFFGIQ